MEVLDAILTLGVVAALWLAAVLLGRDSRDGGDWMTRTNLRDRPPRIGD